MPCSSALAPNSTCVDSWYAAPEDGWRSESANPSASAPGLLLLCACKRCTDRRSPPMDGTHGGTAARKATHTITDHHVKVMLDGSLALLIFLLDRCFRLLSFNVSQDAFVHLLSLPRLVPVHRDDRDCRSDRDRGHHRSFHPFFFFFSSHRRKARARAG